MAGRPTFIDLGSGRTPQFSSQGQASPRITYSDGEIPPAMSPLDAFAMQSRLLARQLDDSQKQGRRLSRLPPLTMANSLARPRPDYLRSPSVEAQQESSGTSPQANRSDSPGNITQVAEPLFRPQSCYPRLSGLGVGSGDGSGGGVDTATPPASDSAFSQHQPSEALDYFAVPRSKSHDPVAPGPPSVEEHRQGPATKPQLSPGLILYPTGPKSSLSTDPASSRGYSIHALGPPRSPQVWHLGSARSIPAETSDHDNTSSAGASWMSQPKELSSSGGVSASHLPSLPVNMPRATSPSTTSEASAGGHLARPSFNFSRPLSRSSRPSIDIPSRQPSSESQRLIFADDTVHTPLSINSDDYFTSTGQAPAAAPSYIYAKYSLPRGRMLQRDSLVFDGNSPYRTEYEQPPSSGSIVPVTPTGDDEPPSPLPTPFHTSQADMSITSAPDFRSTDESAPRHFSPAHTPVTSHHTYHSCASTNSGSTIRATGSRRPPAGSAELSAEDHLSKGIECHDRGSLNESTYHLRIAAKQNHPTAMLLYALACRHGWGMRPNQREGVEWLRKAADSASLEVADDEDLIKEGKPTDFHERQTRRAQFALSIYELGVSHLNGWGIKQDKALALRCFEIAGTWGDGDALAEAGFCYAQGVGCKKDLKKAARFYRMAESKGISTIGNSW